MQAARQAAEQRSEELSSQVDQLTEQAVESAADAQRTLDASVQKAAKDLETVQVCPSFRLNASGQQCLTTCCCFTLPASVPVAKHSMA